jgi:hypothetical protein
MTTASIATAVGKTIKDRGFEPSVVLAIFGTDDPSVIARAVDDFVRLHLHSDVAHCLWYESSQGAVFGLLLQDEKQVVIKAHQPDRSAAFLAAVHDVQRHLSRQGFPCPAPLLGPRPLGRSFAVIDELIDEGSFVDAHDPAVRREMARTLASLVGMTRGFVSTLDLPRSPWVHLPPGSLWREPHHRIFDFEATAAGAEWIDALAAEALERLTPAAGELVVGHTDWSVKDFRFRHGKVTAIYDWDSLAVDGEAVIVGQAATHFTMTWRMPVRVAPSAEEVAAFVDDYEVARGSMFSSAERIALAGAGTYAMAYTARCEHALDPSATDYPPGSARDFLARGGTIRLPNGGD